MDANFVLFKHNYVGFVNPTVCSVVKFRPWIQFLNEHPIIGKCISLDVPLKTIPLKLVCTESVIDNDVVTFKIEDIVYRIDESVVSDALKLPNDKFVRVPSDPELIKFFTDIHYQEDINLAKIFKNKMVIEWYCLFDTLNKVFGNCDKKGFHNISSTIQYIAYAIVFDQRVNIAQLI